MMGMKMSQNQNQMPNMDPDLIQLLKEVEDSNKVEPKPPVIKPSKEATPISILKHEKQVIQSTQSQPIQSVQPAQSDEQISEEIRDKVIEISLDVLNSVKSDRQQIQGTIDLLFSRVQYDDNANRAYVEQLVNALRAKAEVNDVAVRASDSLIKLLVATKRKTTVNNNTLNISSDELKDILKDKI